MKSVGPWPGGAEAVNGVELCQPGPCHLGTAPERSWHIFQGPRPAVEAIIQQGVEGVWILFSSASLGLVFPSSGKPLAFAFKVCTSGKILLFRITEQT